MGADRLRVAVGVLRRADGCVLVAERDPARHQGGRLEFPGGKCEPGEASAAALQRELQEELGVRVGTPESLIRVCHDYGDRVVELDTFVLDDWTGEPHGAEGQPVYWLDPAALRPERFPAANRPIVAALTLPARCLVTPDPSDCDDFLAGLQAALAQGRVDMVQFRAHGLGEAAWQAAAAGAGEICAVHAIPMLVNAAPEAAPALPPGAGLHVPARHLGALTARPVGPDRLFSCACHDADELARADALGADLVFLGPVRATRSHPEAQAMGWSGVSRLAAGTTLPIYVLGGLGPDDLGEARRSGAVGIAGIRGFWSESDVD